VSEQKAKIGGIGDRVKDEVTGFEGIATHKTVWANRCVRYAVEPPVETDKNVLPDIQTFDEDRLLLVESGVVTPTEPKSLTFNHGDHVQDSVTTFEGIITAITTALDGQHRGLIEAPKKKKDEKVPEAHWVDEVRIVMVKSGAIDFPLNPKTPGGGDRFDPPT